MLTLTRVASSGFLNSSFHSCWFPSLYSSRELEETLVSCSSFTLNIRNRSCQIRISIIFISRLINVLNLPSLIMRNWCPVLKKSFGHWILGEPGGKEYLPHCQCLFQKREWSGTRQWCSLAFSFSKPVSIGALWAASAFLIVFSLPDCGCQEWYIWDKGAMDKQSLFQVEEAET